MDFAALRRQVIDRGGAIQSVGRKPDLSEHLAMMEQEFSGQSALLFVHAGLSVHIRREIDLDENLARFWTMWRTETEFLLHNLTSRWLVSACDTIMCHSPCDLERACAMAGSLFMNTIKLYETERLATSAREAPYAKVGGKNQLFDGMTAFSIGGGDMIKSLLERARKPFDPDKISPRILRELINRALTHPTVFSRFAAVHTSEPTRW